jgi:hypothetical protein
VRQLWFVGVLVLACALLPNHSLAQPDPQDPLAARLGLEGARLQDLRVQAAAPASASFGSQPAMSLDIQDAFAAVPLSAAGAKVFWFGGVSVRNTVLGFSGFDPALDPALRGGLYTRVAVVGVVDHLADGRELFAIAFVGRNADDPLADAPIIAGGTVLWRAKNGPDARLGFGASATAEFGEPTLVPVFEYAAWNDAWTIDLRLPFYGQVRRWLTHGLNVGVQWLVEGGDYTVTAKGAPVNEARVTAGTLGALIAFGARTGLEMQLVAGQSLFERYQALHNSHPVVTVNFAPSPYYAAAPVWRF